ncbi:SIS domain-containing protein [Caldibacillus thermoamylovorans]|uniref:SIS domain-containing protein n=1 Tax=Bacillaceae TaxID=186817 RepID=UPI001D0728E4|nr:MULTISPECIES: SIS domain-containing protein [Bacillaceae]MCB5936418.1 SIS domain-containing protein [Bacillus sp. DFI.2.34]MCB7078178.1 SIS domain-containing protein [Caldibacillus thermoamylovorans]MED4853396.1 SIS domain-containing protein [Caldifermentibacillus hisashii]
MEIKNIVEQIIAKVKDIQNVYFVGCGASNADLYPAYYFVLHNSTLKTALITANEFNYDTPADLNEHSVVVTASLGGTTPETVNATSKAKELGANVITLTNEEGSPITRDADYVIVHGFRESYAAKVEKMTYALKIAVEIVEQTKGYEYYEQMQQGFNKLPELIEKSVKLVSLQAKQFAQAYKNDSQIYVLGSGATFDVVYATSLCLFMEMQWINSASVHSGEFFHGALEITDKDVPFILFMNEGKTRALDARVLEFLNRFDAKVTVLDSKDFGLSSVVGSDVCDYFNPMLLTTVMRVYAEALGEIRQHPLTKRRYMWKLEY